MPYQIPSDIKNRLWRALLVLVCSLSFYSLTVSSAFSSMSASSLIRRVIAKGEKLKIGFQIEVISARNARKVTDDQIQRWAQQRMGRMLSELSYEDVLTHLQTQKTQYKSILADVKRLSSPVTSNPGSSAGSSPVMVANGGASAAASTVVPPSSPPPRVASLQRSAGERRASSLATFPHPPPQGGSRLSRADLNEAELLLTERRVVPALPSKRARRAVDRLDPSQPVPAAAPSPPSKRVRRAVDRLDPSQPIPAAPAAAPAPPSKRVRRPVDRLDPSQPVPAAAPAPPSKRVRRAVDRLDPSQPVPAAAPTPPSKRVRRPVDRLDPSQPVPAAAAAPPSKRVRRPVDRLDPSQPVFALAPVQVPQGTVAQPSGKGVNPFAKTVSRNNNKRKRNPAPPTTREGGKKQEEWQAVFHFDKLSRNRQNVVENAMKEGVPGFYIEAQVQRWYPDKHLGEHWTKRAKQKAGVKKFPTIHSRGDLVLVAKALDVEQVTLERLTAVFKKYHAARKKPSILKLLKDKGISIPKRLRESEVGFYISEHNRIVSLRAQGFEITVTLENLKPFNRTEGLELKYENLKRYIEKYQL